MPDNEQTFRFILQDSTEGRPDGGAPSTPAARPPGSAAREAASEARAGDTIRAGTTLGARAGGFLPAAAGAGVGARIGRGARSVPIDPKFLRPPPGVTADEKSKFAFQDKSAKAFEEGAFTRGDISGLPGGKARAREFGKPPVITSATAAGAGAGASAGIGSKLAAFAKSPAGLAVAAGAATAFAGVKAVEGVLDFGRSREQEVGDFSPEIALARARAGVRETNRQIASARILGPTVARQLEAESKLGTATSRATDALLKPILEELTPIIKDMAKIMGLVADVIESDGFQSFLKFMIWINRNTTLLGFALKGLKLLADLLEEDKNEKGNGFLHNFGLEGHMEPPGDQWPGNREGIITGKFRGPPGKGADGNFFRRGVGVGGKF